MNREGVGNIMLRPKKGLENELALETELAFICSKCVLIYSCAHAYSSENLPDSLIWKIYVLVIKHHFLLHRTMYIGTTGARRKTMVNPHWIVEAQTHKKKTYGQVRWEIQL